MATKPKPKLTLKWVSTTQVPSEAKGKTEDLHHYSDGERSIKFRWHGTREFTFVVSECIGLTGRQQNRLLDAYTEYVLGDRVDGVTPKTLEV